MGDGATGMEDVGPPGRDAPDRGVARWSSRRAITAHNDRDGQNLSPAGKKSGSLTRVTGHPHFHRPAAPAASIRLKRAPRRGSREVAEISGKGWTAIRTVTVGLALRPSRLAVRHWNSKNRRPRRGRPTFPTGFMVPRLVRIRRLPWPRTRSTS